MLAFLIALATSQSLYPQQLRISFTENENQMYVTWVTLVDISSIVSYRKYSCGSEVLPNQPWSTVKGTTQLWSPSMQDLIWYYLNYARLTGLQRNCIYEYKVVNGIFRSSTYKFSGRTPEVTAPFEDNTNPIHMWAFGDLGTGANGEPTMQFMKDKTKVGDIDMVFHFGDIAYNLDSDQGVVGDIFLRQMEPIGATIPYMYSLGNHELDHKNITNYKKRFQMPKNDANEGNGIFYSFNFGPVHFINLNSVYFAYNTYRVDELETQKNWLIKDLEEAQKNRDVFPWIIVMTHLDSYCSTDYTLPNYPDQYGECLQDAYVFQDYCQDLLYNNTVDIVFQGHVHNYERDTAIYKNISYVGPYDTHNKYVDSKAPIYIVSGNAGNTEGHNDPISPHPQLWARQLSEKYGIGELYIYNSSHILFNQWESANQTIIDHVWIIKNNHHYQQLLKW